MHYNVVAGPSISVCSGFDNDGMPVSVMVCGKPFSEPTVLNAAYAFEKATVWRAHRPQLSPDMEKPPTGEIPVIPDIAGVDEATKSRAAAAVEGAGLTLDGLMMDEVFEAAPYIYEMSARLRQDLMRSEEPSSIMVAQPAKE